MNFVRVTGTDRLSIAREMYQREHAVALELAKHVAALLTEINHHKADPMTIYNATMVRVSRAAGVPSNPQITGPATLTDAHREPHVAGSGASTC